MASSTAGHGDDGRDVRTGRRGETELPLLKDHRPVFEEESEQRIQGHIRWLGACRLRGDCIAVRREPRRQGRGVGRVSLVTAKILCRYLVELAPGQTCDGQLLVRVDRPIQLGKLQVLLLVCATRIEPGPNSSGAPQRIEERHVGRERKHGGRKAREPCAASPAARAISLQTSRTGRAVGSREERLPAGRSCRNSTSADACGEITLGATPPSISPTL